MNNDLVSIVVINWNGKKWLERCFDSLLSQTYKNFEIVLVDNNSEDGSIEFVKRKYTNVKIISNSRNLGYASGKNIGISNSNGEYILSLDNDTWIDANLIEQMVDFYKSNDFDVIGPLENGYDNLPIKNHILKIDPCGHCVYLEKNNSGKNNFYLAGNCLFFKKSLYIETGGFDDKFFAYFEEVDWFWRLNLLKKSFGVANKLFVHHAGGGSTGVGMKIKYKLFLWRNQNTLQMLLKNYAWYNLLWVLPIYFLQNIVEMIVFLVVGKVKIAASYLSGWWFNLKNLNSILKKRKWVQEHRVIGELEIIKKMYLGFGKLKHLIDFYKLKH